MGLGKAGSGGQLNPLKFGAEVGNCIWRLFLCRVLTSAFVICIKVPSVLDCINSQHDFKGWGEKQRIMLYNKTRFLTLTFVEKWFQRACIFRMSVSDVQLNATYYNNFKK